MSVQFQVEQFYVAHIYGKENNYPSAISTYSFVDKV